MNPRKLITFSFCLWIVLAWAASSNLLSLQEEQKGVIYIPEQVKKVIQEGIQTRESRQDIPFSIVHHLYFPAQQHIHSIFIFNVKNSDLGFAPAVIPKKEKGEPAQEPEAAAQAMLTSENHVFLQVNKLENASPGELVKEVYIPFNLETTESTYDPEQEEIYTAGYPLPPGDYLLSMVIASKNLEKISTQYLELSLPAPFDSTGELSTTPLFFVKEIKQVSTPEETVEIHMGFFAYSILQIEPNFENLFSPEDNLDIFFFIFGAQPNAQNQFDIEVNYEITQAKETVIRFEPTTYPSPLISQPLPLKKTVLTKSDEGEKKESKNLEEGAYTLSIKINDRSTGKSLEKTMDFEVKK